MCVFWDNEHKHNRMTGLNICSMCRTKQNTSEIKGSRLWKAHQRHSVYAYPLNMFIVVNHEKNHIMYVFVLLYMSDAPVSLHKMLIYKPRIKL